MENYKGKSLIDIAEEILLEKKAHTNMYELFDIACKRKGIKADLKNTLIAQFYTDMISSARFVYLGDNEWDLKENQEISLWEKDGSYYKEYNKVEVPADLEESEAVAKKETKAKKTTKKAAKPKKVEVPVEVEVEQPVEVKIEQPAEVEVPKITEIIPEQALEFEEELFDEAEEEFDEDKYNEYMDTYEDQYKD